MVQLQFRQLEGTVDYSLFQPDGLRFSLKRHQFSEIRPN